MSISNHDCTPYYYWYRANDSRVGCYNSYFHKGQKYVLFADEPSRDFIQSNNLAFIGGGDINYLKELQHNY